MEKVVKSYQVIQKDNGKYVVYDSEGKVVIVTTSKSICKKLAEDK